MLQVEAPARGGVGNTLSLPCMVEARLRAVGPSAVTDACAWARERNLPLLVLGAGSNVVLPEHMQAAVLSMRNDAVELIDEDSEHVVLRVGAGKDWHSLVMECTAAGHHGLENLALIPGTVGAAPVQNIGAYGVELAAFVHAVHGVHTPTAEMRTLRREDCRFRYRHSIFKEELSDTFIITAVELRLRKEPALAVHYPALRTFLQNAGTEVTAGSLSEAVIALRRQRLPDPASEPNAGSFFKNPEVSADRAQDLLDQYPAMPRYPGSGSQYKLSAAWLIEHSGLKGLQRGVVAVSDRHALVLVNRGGAVQRDILALAEEVRETVYGNFDLTLEIEPQVYRSDGQYERGSGISGAAPAEL